jgi:hypothetical protein
MERQYRMPDKENASNRAWHHHSSKYSHLLAMVAPSGVHGRMMCNKKATIDGHE